MSRRWGEVLGTQPPIRRGPEFQIDIDGGTLKFTTAPADVLKGFHVAVTNPQKAFAAAREEGLTVDGNEVLICGTRFELTQAK
jgi:hypothetical protein